jgi:hypothetical protein
MLAHVYAGAGEEWIALFSRLTEGATDGTNITGPEQLGTPTKTKGAAAPLACSVQTRQQGNR